MANKTIAQLTGKVGYQSRDGLGYRKTRATAVLVMHSRYLQGKQEAKLMKVLEKLKSKNFDQNQLSPRELEYVFAHFDDDLTAAVIAEYRFIPSMGSIRDLHKPDGHCDLCGKGDSRDDGGNEDKLRYQFLLSNVAGGESIWVGSSCILHHGLHVDGAANAEEAESILKKTLAQHIRVWKIQAWQEANPKHETIPECYEAFRQIPYYREYPDEFYAVFGKNALDLLGRHRAVFRPFRSAARFYGKNKFLTESKTKAWREAAEVLNERDSLFTIFRKAAQEFPPKQLPGSWWKKDWSEAIAELERIKDAQDAEKQERARAAAQLRKARRKPVRKVA